MQEQILILLSKNIIYLFAVQSMIFILIFYLTLYHNLQDRKVITIIMYLCYVKNNTDMIALNKNSAKFDDMYKTYQVAFRFALLILVYYWPK